MKAAEAKTLPRPLARTFPHRRDAPPGNEPAEGGGCGSTIRMMRHRKPDAASKVAQPKDGARTVLSGMRACSRSTAPRALSAPGSDPSQAREGLPDRRIEGLAAGLPLPCRPEVGMKDCMRFAPPRRQWRRRPEPCACLHFRSGENGMEQEVV